MVGLGYDIIIYRLSAGLKWMRLKHLPQAARWDSPLMDTGVEMAMADQGVNRVHGAK